MKERLGLSVCYYETTTSAAWGAVPHYRPHYRTVGEMLGIVAQDDCNEQIGYSFVYS